MPTHIAKRHRISVARIKAEVQMQRYCARMVIAIEVPRAASVFAKSEQAAIKPEKESLTDALLSRQPCRDALGRQD